MSLGQEVVVPRPAYPLARLVSIAVNYVYELMPTSLQFSMSVAITVFAAAFVGAGEQGVVPVGSQRADDALDGIVFEVDAPLIK